MSVRERGAADRSPRERISVGKKLREGAKRQIHAHLHPKKREFDPIAVLMEAGTHRVRELLPIKYGRMRVSPFAFFRGAVSIMAADLARLPNSGVLVQLCGDAHVQNLGSFAGPDGRLVFDINDFDESIRGPFEWDLKRMAASIVLAGRTAERDQETCESAAHAFVAKYCESMRAFSEMPILDVARHQVHRGDHVALIHAALLQSRRARPLDLLKKYTERSAMGRRHFRDQRPLLGPVHPRAAKEILAALATYRESLTPDRRHFFDQFRSECVGFKVVGTGSVGLRDYVVVFQGNGPQDPMFLQVKQEVASAYAKYLKAGKTDGGEGRRTAEGQKALQPMSDLLLGWTRIGANDYLVRQFNDHKGSIDLENLRGSGLKQLALVAGELLARGHARSGDACQIRGYCGSPAKTAKALCNFAVEYADQTEADYRAFLSAIRRGRIKAAPASAALNR